MNAATLPPCYGIIPARYGSSRFPGKPLADIAGKPMFLHVYERAATCPELSGVAIATDDERIADAAASHEVPVIMTRHDHHSGTDRVREAAVALQIADDAVVVNIQGDEPLLDPVMLSELVRPFAAPSVAVTTLAHRLDPAAAQNPDRVKVVLAADGRALYFSRALIPHARDPQHAFYLGHIGLYAFRRAALDRFVNLPQGRLEQMEKLEQLRMLENGIAIYVAITDRRSLAVDRPEDIDAVLRHLRSKTP
ncbi:MAG: 3-deoxy-manno-octulosonate cytidylyltransferase [Thermodesulfobacteriota bacterium]